MTSGTVSPSIKVCGWGGVGDGGLLKTVTSPRFSSSNDGNGDSNSEAQATQGTRECWGILAKAGHRDLQAKANCFQESLQ